MARTKSKSVLYHAPNAKPKLFVVLKEQADGTVEIGPEDGPVAVRGCRVTKEPEMGHVTLAEAEEEVVAEASKPAATAPEATPKK